MSASSGTFKDVETLVGRLISYMEPPDAPRIESWGGKAFQLSRLGEGSRQIDTALLSILSHRWLPILRYMFRNAGATHTDRSQWGGYSRGFGTFHSPSVLPAFWGMLNWRYPHTGCRSFYGRHIPTVSCLLGAPGTARYASPPFSRSDAYTDLVAAVLTYLSEKTHHLDITDVVQTLENLPPSSDFSLDICEVQAVYIVLRYTPMEYLPKSVRIELTKKAVVFDGQLISALKPRPLHDNLMGVLSLSREYIGRSLAHATVFNRLVQYILL